MSDSGYQSRAVNRTTRSTYSSKMLEGRDRNSPAGVARVSLIFLLQLLRGQYSKQEGRVLGQTKSESRRVSGRTHREAVESKTGQGGVHSQAEGRTERLTPRLAQISDGVNLCPTG